MMKQKIAFGLALLLLVLQTACGMPAQGAGLYAETTAYESAAETTAYDSAAGAPEYADTAKAPESAAETDAAEVTESAAETDAAVEEDGSYTGKEEVALYLSLYGHLPDNYITKKEARELGWDASAGNLWDVAPGRSIGGDRFGNYEGSLPEEDGRDYFECDIDYEGGRRNAKRIVFSDDGLIFYTEDHYESFEQLY